MPVRRLRAVDLRMCSQSESEVGARWACEQPRALSWVSHKQEEERDLVGWDHFWIKKRNKRGRDGEGMRCIVCCSVWNSSRRQSVFLWRRLTVFLSTVDVCLPWTSLTVTSHLFVLCCYFSSNCFCRSSVGSALPRRRCCAYITIGIICIFIGVGLTVSAVGSFFFFSGAPLAASVCLSPRFQFWCIAPPCFQPPRENVSASFQLGWKQEAAAPNCL